MAKKSMPSSEGSGELLCSNHQIYTDTQRKTFLRWCNYHLRRRELAMTSLEDGLADGISLPCLVELLSGARLLRSHRVPKLKVQILENLHCVLDFLCKTEQVKLVGIGASDLYDRNTKLCLGLVWTLLQKYQFSSEGGQSAASSLLLWCNEILQPDWLIADFSSQWVDGFHLAGLLNHLCLQHGKPLLSVDDPDNTTALLDAVFTSAWECFQIPKLLDPADLACDPDPISIMTYVSYFREKDMPQDRHAPQDLQAVPWESELRLDKPSEGLKSNQPVSVCVTCRNQEALAVPHSLANVTVQVFPLTLASAAASMDPLHVSTSTNQKGEFVALFVPVEPGTYLVVVCVDGENVSTSPMTLEIV